jgi:hypothetical protein
MIREVELAIALGGPADLVVERIREAVRAADETSPVLDDIERMRTECSDLGAKLCISTADARDWSYSACLAFRLACQRLTETTSAESEVCDYFQPQAAIVCSQCGQPEHAHEYKRENAARAVATPNEGPCEHKHRYRIAIDPPEFACTKCGEMGFSSEQG